MVNDRYKPGDRVWTHGDPAMTGTVIADSGERWYGVLVRWDNGAKERPLRSLIHEAEPSDGGEADDSPGA